MESILKNIEDLDFYQAKRMLNDVGVTDIEVNRLLINRIKHLTNLSSSFEQYMDDLNLINSVALEEVNNGNYEEAIKIYKSAYHEFKYIDLLYYIGKMYYCLHNLNKATEYFRRYIMFGGYLKIDKTMYYLSLIYNDCNKYESENFYRLSKKYSNILGHTLNENRM